MTDVTQTLKVLVELQKRDVMMDELKAKKACFAPQIEEAKRQCSAKRAGLDAHRENHKKLLLRGKELDRSLQDSEAGIKKHQNELNQVKSNDAFKALQHEIDGLKAKADSIENDMLANMDNIAASSAEEKKLAAAFAAEEVKSAAVIAEFEREGADLDEQIEVMLAARKTIIGPLSESAIIAKYEKLRSMRAGVAVCEAKFLPTGAACSACNMRILAHTAVDLKKRGALVVCDNCQRILFTPETLI